MTRSGAGVTRRRWTSSVDALQDVLASEHAALWCYALVLAFLPADQLEQARPTRPRTGAARLVGADAGRRRGARGGGAAGLRRRRSRSPTGPSAAGLAGGRRVRLAGAWKSVLERTAERELRRTALEALQGGTLRGARWRAIGRYPRRRFRQFPGPARGSSV